MRARYVGSLLPISTTTTDPERTYPWGKSHPKRARFNHPKSGRSWPFAKRVDCTIATNDEQPEYRIRAHDFLLDRSACIHCICARSSAGSQVLCANLLLEPRLVTVLTEQPTSAPHGIFVRDKRRESQDGPQN